MSQVELYRCKDCGLEVALAPPVSRPCPACGGEFVALRKLTLSGERDLYTPIINKIIESGFDQFMDELEGYLEVQANG